MDHEAGDDAMEGRVIVCARCAQSKKVLGGFGYRLAENLELYVTMSSVKLDMMI